jgi:hypothetical protein
LIDLFSFLSPVTELSLDASVRHTY